MAAAERGQGLERLQEAGVEPQVVPPERLLRDTRVGAGLAVQVGEAAEEEGRVEAGAVGGGVAEVRAGDGAADGLGGGGAADDSGHVRACQDLEERAGRPGWAAAAVVMSPRALSRRLMGTHAGAWPSPWPSVSRSVWSSACAKIARICW